MKFRKFIKILHRDIGYIVFGLVLIYSISGIAVNHVNDWNPNYIISRDTLSIPDNLDSLVNTEILTSRISDYYNISDSIKSSFRSSPSSIDLFFENKTLMVNFRKDIAVLETVKSRSLIRGTNFLHLNNPKKIWTWVADIFAVGLIVLACTGLFMINGKNGIKGRGKWLTLIGILIPIVFLLIYF